MINMSLYGGAPFFIKSNGGFEMMPTANPIVFESQNIPNAKFTPPQVSGKFFYFLSR